ncbi:hypothetical protein [Streptomyces sp. NPDC015131]|uniref:hypothetical protein n=1 Tax=Streptomyces sp. NPDC015131 TaxID=3364941 RepID=UPI0036FCA33B
MTNPRQQELNRKAKQRRYLHSIGRPPLIDAEPVIRHARWLHDEHGMSLRTIGRRAGVSPSFVSRLVNGERCDRPIRRLKAEAIMAVRPEMPVRAAASAHVDITGSQRRAQALMALGFTGPVLSEELGFNGHVANLWRVIREQGVISAVRRDRIRDGYEKLQHADPSDFGASVHAQARIRTVARSRDWAPPSCWDDDTIDDPDAIPEWTGACGSERGYQIHYREHIPFCEPCREAHQKYKTTHPGSGTGRLHDEAVWKLADEGLANARIADELAIGVRTVERALERRQQR